MIGYPEFVTVDKFGPNATIVRGQIGDNLGNSCHHVEIPEDECRRDWSEHFARVRTLSERLSS